MMTVRYVSFLTLSWVLAVTFGTSQAQDCTNAAATPSVCAYDADKNAAARTKIKGVLLFDWTNGGNPRQYAQRSMLRLAQKYGFRLDRSESRTYITPATLEGIDLIIFNNGDQDPLQNAVSLAAVRDFVEVQGKSILVIHAGAAYIPCLNENLADPGCRWLMRGLVTQFWVHNNDLTKGTIYADSVIAGQVPPRATATSAVPSARDHGRKNPETIHIFENLPTNGGAGALANAKYIWEGLGEEWYNYRNNPRLEGERTLDNVKYGPVNILLSLDESSIANNANCSMGGNCKNIGTFGDRPVSWTRKVGNGMIAYQSAGHSDVYVRARAVGGANVNDSLIEKYNWRLMKYLARDFVGCMIPGDANYNPEASVIQLHPEFDPANPCAGTTAVQAAGSVARVHRISAGGRLIRIDLAPVGIHQVQVIDMAGRQVFSRFAYGPGQMEVSGLGVGRYVVQVASARGKGMERVELR